MRLLITTQKIDQADPVLGFFCQWVEELAKHFQKITVICLEKGEHKLPDNVRVFSLGKETYSSSSSYLPDSVIQADGGAGKIQNTTYKILSLLRYILRFKLLIWKLRKEYDSVFVHMNPEYMLVGGLLWRLLGKRTALWYNHPAWNWRVKYGSMLANKVFHTSLQASTARLAKSKQMPVGIDTGKFRKSDFLNLRKDELGHVESYSNGSNSILSLGRISKYKRIHVMLDAIEMLHARGVDFHFNIYGSKVPEESKYYEKMIERMKALEEVGKLTYAKGVAHEKLPSLYNEHAIFINSSQAGNFDKTILEAAACESLVLTSNPALKDIWPTECIFKEDNPEDLAQKLSALLKMSNADRDRIGGRLRQYVVDNHQLDKLVRRLKQEFVLN